MNDEKRTDAGLVEAGAMSRCSFLRTAALTGAAVAAGDVLTACSAGPNAAYDTTEELFVGVCRGNCFGGCPMNVHVRDGRLVRTSAYKMPEDQWTRICSKGLTSMYRTYSKERIKYPMKRAGERGADQWERISWEEAIAEITDKIKQIQKEDGPESLAMMFESSGNYACASGTNLPTYAERFMYATYSSSMPRSMASRTKNTCVATTIAEALPRKPTTTQAFSVGLCICREAGRKARSKRDITAPFRTLTLIRG